MRAELQLHGAAARLREGGCRFWGMSPRCAELPN